MQPETLQQYRDDLARVRHERDQYAKRAIRNRKEATELRRKRDWLGALVAAGRASEYRKTRDQYAEEVRRLMKIISA